MDIKEDVPIKTITAEPFSRTEYWQLIVKHRQLIWIFAVQEIKTIYAQTYLGVFLSLIKVLFSLSVFTVIFGYFLNVKTHSPYFLFAFSGMIAWNLFSQIAIQGSTAITQRNDLIKKIFFPKLILILSKSIVMSIEFAISLLLLVVIIAFSSVRLGGHIFTLPLFIILNFVIALAVAIWMSSLNIRFRDLNQLLPTAIGIGIWLTPIFFPTTIIPEKYSFFLYANPLAGVIKGFRYALLGEAFPELAYWWSILVFIIIFVLGLWYLRHVEDKMVDYA